MSDIPPPVVVGPGIVLPEALLRRWGNAHDRQRLDGYLARLPELIATWCDRYDLTLSPEPPTISYNLVFFGSSPMVGHVVIKTSPPSGEVASEIEALRQAAGQGMVRLIDADFTAAIMLLERIEPGTMLHDMDVDDEESTRIGAETMLRFWRKPVRPDHLWPLETWSRDLLAYDPARRPDLPEIPSDLIASAQAIGKRLLATPRDVTLLHGDVHHQNILWGGDRGWVTIDPKGLIGERGYEVGTWMMNKWGFPNQPDFLELANRRLDIFARMFNEDRQRLAEWSAFHATLSLCWTLSDETPHDISEDVAFIRNMFRLLG